MTKTGKRAASMAIRRLKAGAAALALSALVGGAMFMPLTISENWLQEVPLVARHYCPLSGQFAEQYFRSSMGRSSAEDFVICLGAAGERVSDPSTHRRLIRDVWLVWTAIIYPLFYGIFSVVFGPHTKWRSR